MKVLEIMENFLNFEGLNGGKSLTKVICRLRKSVDRCNAMVASGCMLVHNWLLHDLSILYISGSSYN